MIAVKPVDDFQRPVDRLEVAVLKALEELEEHLLEPGDLQPGEVFGRRDPAVAQLLTQDAFGSLPGQPFLRADFVDPGAGDEEARTRWARVTLERFDRLDGFVGVMGAFERLMEKARAGEGATVPASAMMTCLLAEKLREKESGPFQARLSNLPHYAATGVKAQAFVPVLF